MYAFSVGYGMDRDVLFWGIVTVLPIGESDVALYFGDVMTEEKQSVQV